MGKLNLYESICLGIFAALMFGALAHADDELSFDEAPAVTTQDFQSAEPNVSQAPTPEPAEAAAGTDEKKWDAGKQKSHVDKQLTKSAAKLQKVRSTNAVAQTRATAAEKELYRKTAELDKLLKQIKSEQGHLKKTLARSQKAESKLIKTKYKIAKAKADLHHLKDAKQKKIATRQLASVKR